jgi:transcriptional regulator with XRE-family HTH domain
MWTIQLSREYSVSENLIKIDERAGEPIGDLIRNLRHRRGLTQGGLAGKLADVSGNDAVNRRQIARWEHGKRIPGRYWRNWIGLALDVPVGQLNRAAAFSQFLRAVPDDLTR